MSNYGTLQGSFSSFSDDEKLNYSLKIALSRLQTDLKADWFNEPTDFIPKQPLELYKNTIPSYKSVNNFLLIDPDVNGDGTEMVTNITVGDILSVSSNGSQFTLNDILNTSKVRNPTQYSELEDSDFVDGASRTQIKLLGRNMFTRYKYWTSGLTGKNSLLKGDAKTEGVADNTGTTPDLEEPFNAYITYTDDGINLSSERTWSVVNGASESSDHKKFYNKLISEGVELNIIDPTLKSDLTKKHPFLKLCLQVPTYTTRGTAPISQNDNNSSSGQVDKTDNIGFHNPLMEKALGDTNGFLSGAGYQIAGWNGLTWKSVTTSYGTPGYQNILYFLSNPGFILIYGQKNIDYGYLTSRSHPPMISFIKYTGETFSDGIISQGETLPAVSLPKDLFINTSDNTIHRYNGSAWVSVGGGGGGSINELSDALVENDSIYLGNDPSSTTDDAQYNVAVGTTALDAITTGDSNVAVGYNALLKNTTGKQNVAIGYQAQYDGKSYNNTICLGYNASVTANNMCRIGNDDMKVGIGTSSPECTLDVNGDVKINGGLTLKLHAGWTIPFLYPNPYSSLSDISNIIKDTSDDNKYWLDTDSDVDFNIVIESNETLMISKDKKFNIKAGYTVYNKGIIYMDGDPTTHTQINNSGIFVNKGKINSADEYEYFYNKAGAKFYNLNKEQGPPYTTLYNFTQPAGSSGGIVYDIKEPTSGDNIFNFGRYNYNYSTYTPNFIEPAGSNQIDQDITALIKSGDKNFAIGYNALTSNTMGEYNTTIGHYSLNTNTTGDNNTAIGYGADVGSSNLTNATAIGYNAKVTTDNTIQLGNTNLKNVKTSGTITSGGVTYPNTHGDTGQFLKTDGSGKLSWATSSIKGLSDALVTQDSIYLGNPPDANTLGSTAEKNTAIGINSLTSNTTGYTNTACGFETLKSNTIGSENTAVGNMALRVNNGDYNTASGYIALYQNTTGNNNTASGNMALYSNTTGDNNTAIGYGADVTTNNLTNATAIGYDAKVTTDDTIQLGNTNLKNVKTSGTITSGGVTYPNTDGDTGQFLQTDGSGTLSWAASDITDLSDALVENNSIYLGNDPSSTTETAQYNVAVGKTALNAITTGDNNVAVGYNALTLNNTGYDNTASGSEALSSNTTGNSNTAAGAAALSFNNEGVSNTAYGKKALHLNTTGSNNTAIGAGALYNNETGERNIAIGVDAHSDGINDADNIVIGNGAQLEGDRNVLIGNRAALGGSSNSNVVIGNRTNLSEGNSNVIIGYHATISAAGLVRNATAIGSGTHVDTSNKIRLGNASVTAITGAVMFSRDSDKRIKKNVKDGDLGLDFITKLRPVKYKMVNPVDYPEELLEKRFQGENPAKRPEDNSRVYDGLIAQEVEETLKKINKTWSGHNIGGGEGKQQSLAYSSLTMPLIKSVQQLNNRLITQESGFIELKKIDNIQQQEKTKLTAAESRITALERENTALKAWQENIESRLASLESK